MRRALNITVVGVAMLAFAGAAWADWDPGDGDKMHYPQLPDPFGWDVQGTAPAVLADDWQCTQTGPVSDVHIWGSWEGDVTVPLGEINSIRLSIHDNLPADASVPWSRPGILRWEADFDSSQFTVRDYGTGQQGWLDPLEFVVNPNDHFVFHQINIVDIQDPFVQKVGEVYWLDVSVTTESGLSSWGWKTSQDHFMDDAVYEMPGSFEEWWPLEDPFTGESLDLAFVITPEPATMALLGLGALALLKRRRR